MPAWSPRVLLATTALLTALPVPASPPALFPSSEALPRVVLGEEGRRLNAAGDRVYAEGLSGRAARNYYLLRPGPAITGHSGERLGRSTIALGKATLISRGQPALLRILQARREIRPGDYLLAINPERSDADG
ncbi:hypothetical protein [Spiribacter roseus]|jgi:hypothetical protein|uniref:hypothetical protein n=1 Tax=Spiribacter roseus TaxID=1855875 RepID=UPI000F6BEED2|nr:hypothetical protein [Spiribacter roseus]AUB79202.1 hypothetical protein BBH56_08915 [Spiribacter roseus]KAF0282071.1 hypothetical protein BA900_05135 [Spiribacter roseus]